MSGAAFAGICRALHLAFLHIGLGDNERVVTKVIPA
jgi:hypothetical protein